MTTENCPNLKQFYSLSTFQTDTLTNAANGESVSFGLMEVADSDPPEQVASITDNLRQMTELVQHGVLQEVTSMFGPNIEKFRALNNRGFRVFAITDIGLRMFHRDKKRKAN